MAIHLRSFLRHLFSRPSPESLAGMMGYFANALADREAIEAGRAASFHVMDSLLFGKMCDFTLVVTPKEE